tara:strand:- start:1456 stop:1617 length:162 start_codon:yes stop_codon:yes gene_type:complete
MKTKKQKLNFYYLPVKMRYKLTNVVPVVPVEPINKELELYLLLNIWGDRGDNP